MSSAGSRPRDELNDRRISIASSAFERIPHLGPATWTVYSYLVYCAARRSYPTIAELARNCGLSDINVSHALLRLQQEALLDMHCIPERIDEPLRFRTQPATSDPPAREHRRPPTRHQRAFLDGDESDVLAPADHWLQHNREKRALRAIFSAFLRSLGDEPAALSDDLRERYHAASRLVYQAKGTPEQVEAAIKCLRQRKPGHAIDPIWIGENWHELRTY